MPKTLNVQETFGSQSLLPISEIRNNIIILKNGALRSLIEIKGVNLMLMPQEEQESIIYSWQSFLNNLEFSLEVIALSRKTNIDQYISQITEATKTEQNQLLKYQIDDYITFISDFIKNYPIMKKTFYIVVPYDPIVIKTSTIFSNIKDMFSNILNLKREAFATETIMPEEEFQRNYQQLLIRQDTILTYLIRMGLEANIVQTDEIIQLFYNLYNPDNTSSKIIV
jgi:hypothetical protein